jgi:putative copper export protein
MPPLVDLAIAAWRWLEYAGLLGFVGVMVVRRLAATPPEIHWARPPMQPALAAAFTGGVAVLIGESLRLGHAPTVVIVRVAAEGIALALCVYGRRWVVPPAIFAVFALTFAGHAASANPAAGAVFVDVIHVLSAGAWAGGIFVLATLRPPAGWGGEEGRAMLLRFGRVAFLAFAITALTGALRVTEELRGLDDLWETPYGLVLSLKTAGVLIMVAMSALTWRRDFRYARAEGALVLIVLAATALLAAFPMPPGQA